MLKLDMNVIFNILNILILYLLMKKFLFGPVTAIMEKRKNLIKTSIEEAENKNNEALELKRKYEETLENAAAEADTIIREAKQIAAQETERQLKATKEEIAQMMESARKSIEHERAKMLQEAQGEIAGVAMVLATKLIQKNLDENSNKKFMNDFLSEAGMSK